MAQRAQFLGDIHTGIHEHGVLYRRSALGPVSQYKYLYPDPVPDPVPREGYQREFIPPVANCRIARTKKSFPVMHVDTSVIALDALQDYAANHREEISHDGSTLHPIRMTNFWAPLDNNEMLINFLAFRDSGAPTVSSTWHKCPHAGEEPLPFVFSRLKWTDGYVFWTGYTMHGAIEAFDPALQEDGNGDKNCRASIEFRFFYLGGNQLERYQGPDEGLDDRADGGGGGDTSPEHIRPTRSIVGPREGFRGIEPSHGGGYYPVDEKDGLCHLHTPSHSSESDGSDSDGSDSDGW